MCETKKKLPQEPGFYWAKTGSYKWFNAIVNVYGEAPFFRIVGWHTVDDVIFKSITDITEFGDKIEEMELV